MVAYADKTLTCRDCGAQFQFTAGEQEFYASRGLENEPGRCPDCRSARKAQRGGYSSGGYSSGGARSREPRAMFPTTCSACGAETEVPFQPRTDKPVYCTNCFQSRRAYR
ncbi:MAG: zinc-binding protein [Chloroflexota bacterium]|nr:MAG: zinc-binding protein [Chloroflexota bacterium]